MQTGQTAQKTHHIVGNWVMPMLTDKEIKNLELELISQIVLGYIDDLRIIEENYVSPTGETYWRVIYIY